MTTNLAPPAALVSVTLLHSAGASASVAPLAVWSDCLSASCAAHGITTRLRIAAFLANVFNETGNLLRLHESLIYSTEALLSQWPSHFSFQQAQAFGYNNNHTANERQIAELAYGGRGGNGPCGSGDGYLFRGAGGLNTTFRGNHTRLAAAIGWTKSIIELPAYLQTPKGASDSAAIFWQQSNCNAPADTGNIAGVRKIINGGSIGLQETMVLYNRLLQLIR